MKNAGMPLVVYSRAMSERKKLAAEARDARNAPGENIEELSTGQRKHKDKKRWCKGKVGVEHQGVCMPYKSPTLDALGAFGYEQCRQLVCSRCGKVLDSYFFVKGHKRKKPAWVTS